MKLKKTFIATLSLMTALSTTLPSFADSSKGFTRFSGKNNYETSLLTGYTMRDTDTTPNEAINKNPARNNGSIHDYKVNSVVFANGDSFADSLSALNIVNTYNAKLILVTKDTTADEAVKLMTESIKDIHLIDHIYIIGGEKVISKDFEKACEAARIKYGGKNGVHRIWGEDRYATNYETIAYTGVKNEAVTTGENFADALSAAEFLHEKGLSLKLVNGQKPYTLRKGEVVKYTLGGPAAVKQNGGERIYGEDRYLTAIELAKRTTAPSMVLAAGTTFQDALCASNICHARNAYTILVPDNAYIPAGLSAFKNRMKNVYVVGNQNSVSDEKIDQMIGVKPHIDVNNLDVSFREQVGWNTTLFLEGGCPVSGSILDFSKIDVSNYSASKFVAIPANGDVGSGGNYYKNTVDSWYNPTRARVEITYGLY
ncbi:MAG: cell wall-binding repeat-containing protein [Clostridioides sp.]|jgi:putative cell wall-binding protein|nr:cell wall-binding repeat-containing protein [Clostridioides sp.]